MPRWKPEAERYEASVKRGQECWEWIGCLSDTGYGNFYTRGRLWLTHRYAWEQVNGAIPKGLCVLHRCDNRKCVRPDHLFLGTKRQNSADMLAKGRHRVEPQRGEMHGESKLTATQVVAIRRRRAAGEKGVDLAAEFGVSPSLVALIHQRKAWRHLP